MELSTTPLITGPSCATGFGGAGYSWVACNPPIHPDLAVILSSSGISSRFLLSGVYWQWQQSRALSMVAPRPLNPQLTLYLANIRVGRILGGILICLAPRTPQQCKTQASWQVEDNHYHPLSYLTFEER
jgi:hypothetical protein